ncbi:hypothetical protein EZS27_011400 [termite gut metagenome]|uniref:Uncharacterized protein n=1 Tax=termite gut metagenome TaxID=433724 RepID=A0A5J4S4Q4_9ZZZZ
MKSLPVSLCFLCVTLFYFTSCSTKEASFDVKEQLTYCNQQIEKTIVEIEGKDQMPHNIMDSLTSWKLVPITIGEWTG